MAKYLDLNKLNKGLTEEKARRFGDLAEYAEITIEGIACHSHPGEKAKLLNQDTIDMIYHHSGFFNIPIDDFIVER